MSEETLSVASTSSDCVEPQKRKIELCRSFQETGFCRYGYACFFAHGLEELLIEQPILKTKVCRNYQRNNQCKYGDRCNFKHEKVAKKPRGSLVNALNHYPELVFRFSFGKKSPHVLAYSWFNDSRHTMNLCISSPNLQQSLHFLKHHISYSYNSFLWWWAIKYFY